MDNQISKTAVKLSNGPLGIVALFIVLIYSVAGLVVGISNDIGDFNRTMLVGFLALFPFAVLGVFGWLVAYFHENLYPPDAFRDDTTFVDILKYGRPSFDIGTRRGDQPKEAEIRLENLNKSATGSLYWLGHDLMWTADVLLRQGPLGEVLIGLEQAQFHLGQIGLGNSQVARELDQVKETVNSSSGLSAALRDAYANQLGSIIDRIGITAEQAQQPEFQKPPHWNRVRDELPKET